MRFLAAFRVMVFHYVAWDRKAFWWRGLMTTPVSVSYFFVSSGFLLAYNYSERVDRGEMNYGRFWLGRCARLLPVYFLGLLAAFPFLLRDFSLPKATQTVLLVQAWFPDSALYWSYPAWALSDLAFFYVSLPFLLRVTRFTSRRSCLLLAGLAWLTSLGLSLAFVHFNPDGLRHMSDLNGFWLKVLMFNPLVRLPEFFVGVMAGRLFLLTGGFRRQSSNAVFFVSSLLILATLLLGSHIPFPVINTGLLAPLLALAVSSLASGGFAARLFQPRWFVLLGQSSYCLYMLHAPLWDYAQQLSSRYWHFGYVGDLSIILIIVLLSLALYKWVEAPATATLRRVLLPALAQKASAPGLKALLLDPAPRFEDPIPEHHEHQRRPPVEIK
jgi:peptidoglycan/LPS O-acetylase OafA/YrhL